MLILFHWGINRSADMYCYKFSSKMHSLHFPTHTKHTLSPLWTLNAVLPLFFYSVALFLLFFFYSVTHPFTLFLFYSTAHFLRYSNLHLMQRVLAPPICISWLSLDHINQFALILSMSMCPRISNYCMIDVANWLRGT